MSSSRPPWSAVLIPARLGLKNGENCEDASDHFQARLQALKGKEEGAPAPAQVVSSENRTKSESSSCPYKVGDPDVEKHRNECRNIETIRALNGNNKFDENGEDNCDYEDDLDGDSGSDVEDGEDDNNEDDDHDSDGNKKERTRRVSPAPVVRASQVVCGPALHGVRYADGVQCGTSHTSIIRTLASCVRHEKRERRLARNRETSRARREREKSLIEHLDSRFLLLSRQNNELRNRNERLKKALEKFAAKTQEKTTTAHSGDPDATLAKDTIPITTSPSQKKKNTNRGSKRIQRCVPTNKPTAKKVKTEDESCAVTRGKTEILDSGDHFTIKNFDAASSVTSVFEDEFGANEIRAHQVRRNLLDCSSWSQGIPGIEGIPEMTRSACPSATNRPFVSFPSLCANSDGLCHVSDFRGSATHAEPVVMGETPLQFRGESQSPPRGDPEESLRGLEYVTFGSFVERERVAFWANAILSSWLQQQPPQHGVCLPGTRHGDHQFPQNFINFKR